MTKNQKLTVVVPLCNLLIELLEDKDVISTGVFRHELKRSTNNFIKELEQPSNVVHFYKSEKDTDLQLANVQKEIVDKLKIYFAENILIDESQLTQ